MGCCFSSDGEQSSSERKSLLRGDYKYSKTQLGGATNTTTTQPASDFEAQSARSSQRIATPVSDPSNPPPITIKPVNVADVDKRLQDHGRLFNEHLERRNNMNELVQELNDLFPSEKTNKNVHDCFYHIRIMTKDAPEGALQIKRRFKYCMEIVYDGHSVHYTVIPAFLAFNKANKLIKDIIDKGPPLSKSIQMVIESERDLRRDVLVASLGADGPDCMKNVIDNVAQLKKVPELVQDFHGEAIKTFEQLKSAAQTLITEEHV